MTFVEVFYTYILLIIFKKMLQIYVGVNVQKNK